MAIYAISLSMHRKLELILGLLIAMSLLLFLQMEHRQSQVEIRKFRSEIQSYIQQLGQNPISTDGRGSALEIHNDSSRSKDVAKKLNSLEQIIAERPKLSTTTTRTTTTVATTATTTTVALRTTTEERKLNPCPKVPSSLVGKVKVDLTKYHEEYESEKNKKDTVLANPLFTGNWRPKDCIAIANVAIIIPLRNRAKQLSIFLKHTIPVLQRQKLAYRIFVVEQIGKTAFNKGAMYNLAFNVTLGFGDYSCYIFHDVDLLTENDHNFYGCPLSPLHMSTAIDKFNYKLPYPTIFGGIQAFHRDHYIKVNGFSNLYWGWGAEDDDMFQRVKAVGLKLSRTPLEVGRYKMNKGEHFRSPGRKIWEARNKGFLRHHPMGFGREGLNTISSLIFDMKMEHRQSRVEIRKFRSEIQSYIQQLGQNSISTDGRGPVLDIHNVKGRSENVGKKLNYLTTIIAETPKLSTTTTRTTTTFATTATTTTVALRTTAEERKLSPCPKMTSSLLGKVKVDFTKYHEEYESEKNKKDTVLANPLFTGNWRPKDCIAIANVAIIIPLRNRAKQLSIFLKHTIPVLQRQKLAYRIFVVEQIGKTAFNKGAMYNLAFNVTFSFGDYDCYIFHDVDLLTENDHNFYGCPLSPLHMSTAIDKFKYKLPYSTIFGGIQAFHREHYVKVNGFSNLYWGWGAEDDDMFQRLKKVGLKLSRTPLEVGRYKMNKGEHFRSPGRKIWDSRNKGLLGYHPLGFGSEGLNNIFTHLRHEERRIVFLEIVIET
eukprot:gene19539-21470_t